jgi:hypothetical protein
LFSLLFCRSAACGENVGWHLARKKMSSLVLAWRADNIMMMFDFLVSPVSKDQDFVPTIDL